MSCVRGCFLCVKDHRAADKHSPKVVTEAVRKLKERAPGAYLTFDDLDGVVTMCWDKDEGNDENDDTGEEAHYVV